MCYYLQTYSFALYTTLLQQVIHISHLHLKNVFKMPKSTFDSSKMLPLFQIISPSSSNAPVMDSPADAIQKHKKKSKRPEVPVHKSHKEESASADNTNIRKNFSANFSKHKHKREEVTVTTEENADSKPKVSRKLLMREYERILGENQKLNEQLTLLQTVVSKRESLVLKLKEKLSSVQNFNKELLNENNIIKTQYQDILVSLEELKTQLEAKSKCMSCADMKIVLKKLNKELDSVKAANKDLNLDLNMLKNVIYRLNVQLERYQEKLCKANALTLSNNTLNASSLSGETDYNTTDAQNNIIPQTLQPEAVFQHRDHMHTPISWGSVNTHTLGPLLDAYQDTIREKDDIIKNYEVEFANFTDKLKGIIDENEMLHKKNIEDSKMLSKNLIELESIRAELKLTKDQNDLLIKKCALKHDKLQEICKVYDHKIECMRRDYEVLQEQYHKTRVELSSLQAKFSSLTEAHDSLKSDKQNVIPLTVHTTSVNECKRLFEELKAQYDNERTKLLNQIKLLEQRTADLDLKLTEIEAEKRELQTHCKSVEKHLKKAEHRLSETQNSLTHVQISRDTCKRQLAKAIDFGRELVNEQESLLQQLSSRQKENKAVKQIGSSIVNRMDILKSQLKTVQKDAFQQLASVEQRIQEQDSSIETMRRDHENEVEKLLKEIQDKDEYIAKLIGQRHMNPATPYVLYRERQMHMSP